MLQLTDAERLFPPRQRVLGLHGARYHKGAVTAVGELQGRPVVYLTWDPRPDLAACAEDHRDTVVASALLPLDAG